MCIYLWCHNCPTPKSFQLLSAHCGQLPVSSLSTSTQTKTLTLPVTHPGEVSFAARILYLDFHNMHNKYKRITSPLVSVYFNFMESNQGEKQHDNQATKFSADCNSGQTAFLGLSLTWWLWCFLRGTVSKTTGGAGPRGAKQRGPCSFSFRVTRCRIVGLGLSDSDNITPSMPCTVCAQICARVSQAWLQVLVLTLMRPAPTPGEPRAEDEACRLWPLTAWVWTLGLC